MTDEELIKFMEGTIEVAQRRLLENALSPVAILISEKEVHVVALDFSSLENKRISNVRLRSLIEQMKSDAVVLVADSYYYQGDKEKDKKVIIEEYSKLEDSKKSEAIFVCGKKAGFKRAFVVPYEKKENKIVFKEQLSLNELSHRFLDGLFETIVFH